MIVDKAELKSTMIEYSPQTLVVVAETVSFCHVVSTTKSPSFV